MAGVFERIGGILAGNTLGGAAQLVDSIKGKSPEDAAKLAQINEDYKALQLKYPAEFRTALVGLVEGQIDTNKAEAGNIHWFIAGWRPYVGWICGTALAVPMLVYFIQCVVLLSHHQYALPAFDARELDTVLMGMLGLGGMRMTEKLQGAAGNH